MQGLESVKFSFLNLDKLHKFEEQNVYSHLEGLNCFLK